MKAIIIRQQRYLNNLILVGLLSIGSHHLYAQNNEIKGIPDSSSILLPLERLDSIQIDSIKLLRLMPLLNLNPHSQNHSGYSTIVSTPTLPLPPSKSLENVFHFSPLEGRHISSSPIHLLGTRYSQRRYTNEDLESKLLGLGIELAPTLYLESSITLGHIRPLQYATPRQIYELYTGLSLKPREEMGLRLGMAWRDDGIYRTLNPHASVHIDINARLSLMLMGGASFFGTRWDGGGRGTQLYAGARLQYKLNNSLYLYGHGRTAYTSHFPSLGNIPWASQWSPEIGGGIGLNIDNSGPIELGVVYRYNVMTKRMEPSAEVNLFGVFSLLVKAIQGILGTN